MAMVLSLASTWFLHRKTTQSKRDTQTGSTISLTTATSTTTVRCSGTPAEKQVSATTAYTTVLSVKSTTMKLQRFIRNAIMLHSQSSQKNRLRQPHRITLTTAMTMLRIF